jgi:hypothetical protein
MKSLPPVLAEIRAFAELEEDFDSYGGLPTRQEAIDAACDFLESLPFSDAVADLFSSSPTPNGEVYLSWRNGDKYSVSVIIRGQGEITCLLWRGSGPAEHSKREREPALAFVRESLRKL